MNKPLVVYVDRSRLSFYGGTLATPSVIDLPPAAEKDLEVLDWDAFDAMMDQWAKQTGTGPSPVILILSPRSYFDKVIAKPHDKDAEKEAESFFDVVPFESLATRTYPAPDGIRAVAVNKLLIEALYRALARHGLRTEAAVPSVLLGDQGKKTTLDAEMGQYVMANADDLAKQSVMDLKSEPVETEMEGKKAAKSQLPILLGVFGALILILVLVLVFRR